MRVKLEYFKYTGKYYSDGEYYTFKKSLNDIWTEVKQMKTMGNLPGLVHGAKEFIIYVRVPQHEHDHPKLIL